MKCYYANGGINYKHGYTSCCAIQHDRLTHFKDTYLPTKIYNSPNFVNLRAQLQSNVWPEGCNLCEELHKKGVTAMIDDYDAEVLEEWNHNGIMRNEGLRHLELRFSNACNMSCLHCSKVYSSGWVKKLEGYVPDHEDINLDQLNGDMHIKRGEDPSKLGLSLAQTEEICHDLMNFPNLTKVDISGGEVLMQKQFWRSLELLAKHPNADKMRMTFYSNFNVEADYGRLSDLLSRFGGSDITISIDAGTNIYPYFRDGNWSTLVENIEKFRSINKFTTLMAVNTFSAYQLLDIENIYKSIYPLGFDGVKTALVQTPRYINPAVVVHDFHDELLEDWTRTIDYLESLPKDKSVQMSLDHYMPALKKYLFDSPLPSYNDYNSFLIYIRKTDKIWGQDFNHYFKKFKFVNNEIVRV